MDIDILLWLQNLRLPAFDRIFLLITELGGEIPLLVILCGIYWCVNKRAGTYLLFCFFGNILVNQFLKIACCINRPWVRDARIQPLKQALEGASGYSFPSGHTANAIVGYGGVARCLKGRKGTWLLWVLALLIGFSRCYVGVHTPQDVLVSIALGVACVFLMEKLMRLLDRKPGLDIPIAIIGMLLSVAVAIYAYVKPYPAGYDVSYSLDAFKFAGGAVGVLAGWALDRRTLRFNIEAGTLKRCVRLAGGLAIVLIIMKLFKAPLNAALGEIIGGFVRYALLGVTASYLWPLAFTKLRF